MLPYTTAEEVAKICKKLIKESGGSQPQPQPEPVPEHYNDFQGLEELIYDLAATDPTPEVDETFVFNYDNAVGETDKLIDLFGSIDAEAVEKIISNPECPCLSSDLYAVRLYETCCISGKVNLSVGVETDVEDPVTIAKYLPTDNQYYYPTDIPHVEGTIRIKYTPAN